ncbi:MAG: alginate export family protein [Planctomycetes bacterium]|nr:alginate export family protein [Planctomycetota bacterium]
MTAKLIALGAIVALLLIPAPVQAQDGAVLTVPGVQKMTLGGELRWRADTREQTNKATNNTSRFRLFMDMQVNDRVSAFIETQYVESDSELGSAFTGANVFQAYGKVTDVFDLADVQFGRFEMKYGNGRILADNWWADTGRTYEGLRSSMNMEGHKLDLIYVRPVLDISPGTSNEKTISGLYFENSTDLFNYDAYAFDINEDGDTDFRTYGALLDGTNMGLAWDFEYAIQNGEGEVDRDDSMLIMNVKKDMGEGLILGLGYESYSETYEMIGSLGHCYSGWADIVRWKNYEDVILSASMPVMDGWKGFAEYHNFSMETIRGSVSSPYKYKGGNASFNSNGQASDDLGNEIDLYIKGNLGKRTGLFLGISRFMPGDAADNQFNQTWMFAQINMKF